MASAEGHLAGEGREVAVAELQVHRARLQLVTTQAPGDLVAQPEQLAAQRLGLADVAGDVSSRLSDFASRSGVKGLSSIPWLARNRPSPDEPAEAGDQFLTRHAGEVADRFDAEPGQVTPHHLPHAPQLADGQRREKSASPPAGTTVMPWVSEVAGDFRD